MTEKLPVSSSNKEILKGSYQAFEFTVEGSNIKRGTFVIPGSADFQVKTATAGSVPIGLVVNEGTPNQYKKTDRTTAFSAGDIVNVAVLSPGSVFMGVVNGNSPNISAGDRLTTGANGRLVKYEAADVGASYNESNLETELDRLAQPAEWLALEAATSDGAEIRIMKL